MAMLGSSNSAPCVSHEESDDRLRRLPPLRAVLEGGGPPSSATLHLYLVDLDDKLDENAKQLDLCLQAVLRFTNELPGDRNFSSPKDGLLHMYNSHVLDKDSCYDPEIDEVVIILDALMQRLEKEPGCEEDVLQELLTLASAEGLVLPLRAGVCDGTDSAVMSTASLHAVMDSGDQIIEQRWNKLAAHLKKYLCEQLLQLPSAPCSSCCSNFSLDRRLELVESYRSLCNDDDTWLKYKALRTQQLEDVFAKLLPEIEEAHVSHKDFARNCGVVADSVIAMIDEDFVILSSGIFRKVTGVFKAIHELYLEKFSDEMSLLVDEIGDEVARAAQQPFALSKSEHGLYKNNILSTGGKPKESPHRNSVGAVANSKDSVSMSRTQAQSLDSMFTVGINLQADSKDLDKHKRHLTIPEECMKSLLSIVLALMRLEDHVEGLLRTIVWDITGLPPKKTRRKASLRGVLKPTTSPEAKRHSIHSLQHQHSGSFSSSDTQLEVISNVSHGETTAPKVVEHSRSEERMRWEWKLIFKKLSSDLSQAVEGIFLEQLQSSLAAESAIWEQYHHFESVKLEQNLQGGKHDYPRITSLASHQFLEVVDQLLPLARVGCDGCLMPVRTTFIDTLCICLKSFHVQLVKMSKEVPTSAPLKQLYLMISTSVVIRNHLLHYETLLTTEEGGKKLFTLLLRQFSELIDALMKQSVQLHSQAIATTILFDADSTNWGNSKDFYEDERCSFPVQMWNFHLRGLRHDLWNICPPQIAQTIFSSVLQDSLLTLMQRYVRVRPSFRRIKQFRYDVTAILLCALDHMFSSSNSVSKLLDPGHGQLPHYSIHNLASNLFGALAVVASPLDVLYKVFKRGFAQYRESLNVSEGVSQCGNTHWMHWIWPELFQEGHKHYDDMQTTSALFLQLNLLMRQPQPNWALLMQALLMKDYSLSVILLKQALMMASVHHSHAETLESGTEETNQGATVDPDSNARGVVFALVTMLAHVGHFPCGLTKCILPAVESCDEWEIFNIKTTSAELKPPLWLEALFKVLDPLIEKILEPVLFFLLKERSPDTPHESFLMHLHDLPCGCQTNSSQKGSGHTVSDKESVQRCLELLIGETQQNIYSISHPLCMLFHALQAACTEHNIRTAHSCVGIQILAWAVWSKMRNTSEIEHMLGLPITAKFHQQLSTLADFYFQIMLYGKTKGSQTPRIAARFHKTHKDWLPPKLDAIANYLSLDMFGDSETDILEGATSIFADQISQEIVATIMATPNGCHYLRLIFNLINNNYSWLFQQLDIHPPLKPSSKSSSMNNKGSKSSNASKAGSKHNSIGHPGTKTNDTENAASHKGTKFWLCLAAQQTEGDFSPGVEFNRIGDHSFDQEAIANFPFNWTAILSSDLGLSEPAFISLLHNRFEMQSDAVLNDTEKGLVEALKTVFQH